MSIQHNLLVKKVKENNIEFLTVTCGVKHDGTSFIFNNMSERHFFISDNAATTLRNLTGVILYGEQEKHKLIYTTSHSEVLQLLDDCEFDKICVIINKSIEKNGDLVISVYNNRIVGFYRNYNGIHHLEVLDEIKKSGLVNRVMPSYVNETDMLVNLRIADKTDEEQYLFNLQVYNNLNSAKGLGYQLYFRFGKMEFTVEFENGSRKHLSKVNLVFEEIQQKLTVMQELNIPKTLKETNVLTFMELLNKHIDTSKKNHVKLLERVNQYVMSDNAQNASDMLAYMGLIADEHGFKGVTKQVGQLIINDLFSL